MPLQTAINGAIPNAGALNSKKRAAAVEAIENVKIDDVWRSGKTIAQDDGKLIRVDSQLNHAPDFANLQAQINGLSSNSTVAALQVAGSVAPVRTPGMTQAAFTLLYDQAQQAVQGALQASLGDGQARTMTGSLP